MEHGGSLHPDRPARRSREPHRETGLVRSPGRARGLRVRGENTGYTAVNTQITFGPRRVVRHRVLASETMMRRGTRNNARAMSRFFFGTRL